jgi:hypothetical protein
MTTTASRGDALVERHSVDIGTSLAPDTVIGSLIIHLVAQRNAENINKAGKDLDVVNKNFEMCMSSAFFSWFHSFHSRHYRHIYWSDQASL